MLLSLHSATQSPVFPHAIPHCDVPSHTGLQPRAPVQSRSQLAVSMHASAQFSEPSQVTSHAELLSHDALHSVCAHAGAHASTPAQAQLPIASKPAAQLGGPSIASSSAPLPSGAYCFSSAWHAPTQARSTRTTRAARSE